MLGFVSLGRSSHMVFKLKAVFDNLSYYSSRFRLIAIIVTSSVICGQILSKFLIWCGIILIKILFFVLKIGFVQYTIKMLDMV